MIESYLGTDESAINRSGAQGASTPTKKTADNGNGAQAPARRRTPLRAK